MVAHRLQLLSSDSQVSTLIYTHFVKQGGASKESYWRSSWAEMPVGAVPDGVISLHIISTAQQDSVRNLVSAKLCLAIFDKLGWQWGVTEGTRGHTCWLLGTPYLRSLTKCSQFPSIRLYWTILFIMFFVRWMILSTGSGRYVPSSLLLTFQEQPCSTSSSRLYFTTARLLKMEVMLPTSNSPGNKNRSWKCSRSKGTGCSGSA